MLACNVPRLAIFPLLNFIKRKVSDKIVVYSTFTISGDFFLAFRNYYADIRPTQLTKMTSKGNEPADEKALLAQLKEGNYEAFEKIYDRYNRQLAGNLMKLLKSRDLVGEALQEIFMRLWNNRANIDPEKPIKAYLFRIGENLAYDAFRRANRDEKMRAYFIAFTTEAYEQIEKALFEKENKQLLHDAIDKLPPQRKRVYMLCKLEEKSYKEISEQLGISTAAVNDHITKANAFLKSYISRHPSLPALVVTSVLLSISSLN